MSADSTAALQSSSSSSSSPSSSDDVAQPAVRLSPNLNIGSSLVKFEPSTSSSPMSLSSPIHFPMLPLTTTSPLLPAGSLFPSPFLTSSLLSTTISSPVSPNFTPDSLQSLLISLRATSSPTVSSGQIGSLVPIQLLPGPLLVLPSSHLPSSSSGLQRQHSLPHPKLLTFSSSCVMHEDIPSSLPCPPSPTASGGSTASAMELSPYTSPHSPLSPLSGSSTDSDDSSSRDSDDSAKSSKQSKRKSRKSLKRPTSLSETDNDDTDSTHSASSSSSSSSSEAAEGGKKRRCVVSAQKLLTDNSAVDLSLSIVHFHHHSIRIIHTHNSHGHTAACYVHGADVGGVIERKSNISRMFGQFHSPHEKVLMNVTGKHNHTVGQEANVLTVAGVERLMTLKKCVPNGEYCDWLRDVLLPRLREGNSGGGSSSGGGVRGSEETGSNSDEAGGVGESMQVKSEAEGEVVNVMATLCTAAV